MNKAEAKRESSGYLTRPCPLCDAPLDYWPYRFAAPPVRLCFCCLLEAGHFVPGMIRERTHDPDEHRRRSKERNTLLHQLSTLATTIALMEIEIGQRKGVSVERRQYLDARRANRRRKAHELARRFHARAHAGSA